MKKKQLLKQKGAIMALLVVLSVMHLQATVFPYVTILQSFGGSSANTSTFTPIPGDYTLEVQGTVGTAISVAGGVYTYTPTTSGTVRFVQKSGVVYIYEGTTYMTSITPTYSSIFPTIADANVTTDANNLLANASFETAGSLVGGTNYNFGAPWVTNVTIPASGGIRIQNGTAGNTNGTWELVWRGSANTNYFAQPITATIKSNTFYKVVVRQIASGNAAANFNIGLGSTVSGMEYASKTMSLGLNLANGQYSSVLYTPAGVSGTTYFTFKNTAVSTATSNSTDPLIQLDYIELIEGAFGTPGISGVSSATYLEGSAYAPDVTVNYSGGDIYDMTPYITSQGFDNFKGKEWVETPAANTGTYANSEVEFFSKTFNLSQALTGLPAGIYRLKAQGFERAKANDAAAAYNALTEVILSKLYATSSVTSYNKTFNSLYLNAFQSGWGGTAVSNYINSTVSANGAFTAGYYDMQLDNIIVGADGALTIGASKATNVTNSWTIMDNFRLYYFGPVVDPLLSAPQTSASLTTTTNTAAISLTGSNLTSDITITVPSTHITLSGANVTGTSPNYTIAVANVNTTNNITVTWDNLANVSGNISFTSTTASKTVAVTTSDIETVALAGITTSVGGLSPTFAVGTSTYTAKVPADASSAIVTATFTPSVANVTNNVTTISASTPSVVLTGNSYNGVAHTADYTVNWGGNYTFTDWAANGDITSTLISLPTTYGWKCMNSTTHVEETGLFNNYGTQGNCRYNDKVSGGGYSYNGTEWIGRLLFIRWDGGSGISRLFSYPVYLGAGTYQINGKAAYNAGIAGSLTFNVNAANDNSSTNYATSSVVTGATVGVLMDIKLINITITTPGVYYFTVSSTTASMCAIADLTLNTQISETFTGSVDDKWSNASNWSTRVPLAGDDVTVLSGTLTVDQNALAKSITVAPGAKLTLATGKTLTATTLNLNSDATGTGTYVDNGTTNISTANVQQYLTSGRNWYLSSPVASAPITVFSNASALYSFDESTATGTWSLVSSGNLTPLKGYVAKVDGTTGTVTFTGGALNTGAISNTSIGTTLTGTAGNTYRGFNLVGNPYPSYVNWEMAYAASTNLESSIWYRTLNASTYVFDTYNAADHLGTSNNNNSFVQVTQYIAPMQAVWVRVVAGTTGTLGFDNTMRSHQDQTIATNRLKAKATILQSGQQVLRLQVSNGTKSDQAIVLFNANASDGYDVYDSPKMSNNNPVIPEIYTTVGNEKVVINGLNSVAVNQEIPLGFTTGQSNAFSIRANEISNFDAGTKVILKDKLLNTEQDLSIDSTYSFTSNVASTTSRFSIVFKSVDIATGVNQAGDNQALIYENANNQITVNCKGSISSDAIVSVYNTLGQKLESKQITSTTTVIGKTFTSGVYVVTVNNGGKNITKTIIIN